MPARFIRHLWNYEGIYREVIATIKYKPSKRLATALARNIVSELPRVFPSCDWNLIVPIPTAKAILLQRGFNQCAILAAACSAEFHITWSVFALSHRGYGSRSRQAGLPREKRFRNVHRAFRASKAIVEQKTILLLDDVMTTGATASVACRELLEAGAAAVDIFSIARSPQWSGARAEIYKKLYSPHHEKRR